MKERPMLFSTPMVKAVLSDMKDITRRAQGLDAVNALVREVTLSSTFVNINGKLVAAFRDRDNDLIHCVCPYGQPGDILWVRETWTDEINGNENHYPFYLADFPLKWDDDGEQVTLNASDLKWKPSIFMPKHLCRLRLEILSIRVERLHDITYQDAVREGVGFRQFELFGSDKQGRDKLARLKFGMLWTSINGQESWDSNPWVWRIEFKKL